MNDEELLEWYKNGAQKQEGMSDQDYETYKSNALYAQKNQLLDSNLAAQQGAIAKQQTNAQQSASISNDKLMKYLGQKQLSSGVATGQTGSDFINANNAYTQNRAMIANNASAQQADLLQRYAGEKLQIGSDAFREETSILDKYYGRNYQEGRDAISDKRYEDETAYQRELDEYNKNWNTENRDYERQWNEEERQYNRDVYADEKEYKRAQDDYVKQQASQDEVFDYLMNDLMTGNFNTTAEMEARIDEFKDFLSPERYQLMKQQITSLFENRSQQDMDKEYDDWANGGNGSSGKYGDFTSSDIRANTKGDNFSLTFNGNYYEHLEIGSKASTEVVEASEKIPNNTVFIFGGQIYVKTVTGGVRRVGGTGKSGVDNTGDKKGQRAYSDLYAALEKAGYILG